ncbi:hypothetical protein RvY_07390 [Ramazzottius varieornatus]|uniref:Xyloside xylosyltransferase 1 n=1 Tax=Ramazzottius varieornatus TaxID=947166 RepID=A0A1D1V551_RAMVA|nr:hypothetical protein RvY_07390 [Ramazzottius varieornatus]
MVPLITPLITRRRCLLLTITLAACIWAVTFVLIHEEPLTQYAVRPEESEASSAFAGTPADTSMASKVPPPTTTTLPSADAYVPVVVIFTSADRNWTLVHKLIRCLRSMFAFATAPVNLIFISDRKSFDVAESVIKRNVTSDKARVRISFLDLEDALLITAKDIQPLQERFRSNDSSYSHNVFLLSIVMHKLLPFHHQVLYVDVDIAFQADFSLLFKHFERFSPDQLIGLAYEQQPVYRHALESFRTTHPNTTVGEPPNKGHPGFNTGVILFDLDKMRSNKKFSSVLAKASILNLTAKYELQGNLSNQDTFSLLGFEYPQWFYVLPCEWNRQLCAWWKNNGFAHEFKSYHVCNKTPKIYHANCNTKLPLLRLQ